MSDTVIKIENLSKHYRLGVIGHGTLYRDLQSWWAKIRKKADPNSLIGVHSKNKNSEWICALNNINLDVKKGEILGVIGSNGSGKSTLLKVLSKVTSPTTGLIKYKGRIASLLEVGTGFHSELTGRENIFLNGAINGMNKREVNKKLDEIVDFSGVEKFLDTPVKRYSSGMYVRLGFAVAAHLDPDILIVDEVLAVGDASFQKKAINKMQDVSEEEGRTVLFVSHNMDSIKQLCTKAILLQDGKIVKTGPTPEVINKYIASGSERAKLYNGERNWFLDEAPGDENVKLISINTKTVNGKISSSFDITDEIIIEITYRVFKEGSQIAGGIHLVSSLDVWLLFAIDDYSKKPWGKQDNKKIGIHKVTYKIPGNLLQEDTISVHTLLYEPPAPPGKENNFFDLKNAISFQVIDSFSESGARGSYPYGWSDPAIRPKIDCVSKYLGE
jgi:lipopolysaccharide transport system ATP-binding protein